jgi:hypothetical protein
MNRHVGVRPIYTLPGSSRVSDARKVIWSFIGLNTVVFGAWQYGLGRFPDVKLKDRLPVLNYLQRNFLLSVDHFRDGK